MGPGDMAGGGCPCAESVAPVGAWEAAGDCVESRWALDAVSGDRLGWGWSSVLRVAR